MRSFREEPNEHMVARAYMKRRSIKGAGSFSHVEAIIDRSFARAAVGSVLFDGNDLHEYVKRDLFDAGAFEQVSQPRTNPQPDMESERFEESRRYRFSWVLLLVLAVIWGTVCGFALSGVGLPVGAAIVGLVALAGLALTLFKIGSPKRNV